MLQSMTALTSNPNRICVWESTVGDVEDPEMYADIAIWDWMEKEPAGQFAKTNSKVMTRTIGPDDQSMGFRIKVFAEFEGKDFTFYSLKYLTN